MLRWMYGPVIEQGIRANQELRELYEDLDIVADIKKRLECIRHPVKSGLG